MFSVPVEGAGGSFFIDVDHDVYGVTSLDGHKENEVGFMMTSGAVGSAMEHVIYEQIFQIPSVSTIKILNEASSRGIPIYTLNKDNISKLSEISAASAVKKDITNAVNSGKVVTIPQYEIRYYDWTGSGYIVMDPETGAAGYMISGGLAGGSTGLFILTTLALFMILMMTGMGAIVLAELILTATNVGALIIGWVLAVSEAAFVANELQNYYRYLKLGDLASAEQILSDFNLYAIIFCGAEGLGAVGTAIPGGIALFKKYIAEVDELKAIANRLGDDLAEAIARISGCKALLKAEPIVKQLDDLGVARETIESIAKKSGLEGLEAGAEAIERAVSRLRTIGVTSETEITRISENAAQAMSKGSKFTESTLSLGGKPKGVYEAVTGDAEMIRSITRQNEAADLLANKGYDIVMLPYKNGGNGYGVKSTSNPDYLIDGQVFDCYSPITTNLRTIWDTVVGKTESQARRILLNLDDYSGSLDDLAKQFNDWPIDALDELLILKNGNIARLLIN